MACLIEAINEGRSSRVVKNLQAGVDPNGEEDGATALMPAKATLPLSLRELLRINFDKTTINR